MVCDRESVHLPQDKLLWTLINPGSLHQGNATDAVQPPSEEVIVSLGYEW
jgi:hypothetical protein